MGIAAHLLLLLWLAPISFTDGGHLAADWVETLMPFSFLAAPLLIAGSIRTKNAFLGAGVASLVLGVIFMLGPGIFLFVPGILYLCAGIGPQEPKKELEPYRVRDVAYWGLATCLVAVGILGMASIGWLFLALGLTLCIVGPWRGRPMIFWPVVSIVVAGLAVYLIQAPASCTSRTVGRTAAGGRIVERSTTTCENFFGDER